MEKLPGAQWSVSKIPSELAVLIFECIEIDDAFGFTKESLTKGDELLEGQTVPGSDQPLVENLNEAFGPPQNY